MGVESGSRSRDSTDVPSIKDLIRAALDAGKSVRQLEADSGYRVRFQTFQELSNHPPKQFPKYAETITGMAAALNVSESTVVLAYATGLGVPVSAGPTFALRLPPGMDSLDQSMQDAIIQVARAAVRSGAGVHAVSRDERKHPFPEVFYSSDGSPDAGEAGEAGRELWREQGGQ